jgi:hypothetical protein
MQAGFDIGQTLPVSDLSERHGEELIPAREVTNPVVAVVTSATVAKLLGQIQSMTRAKTIASVGMPRVWHGVRCGKRGKQLRIAHTVCRLYRPHNQALSTLGVSNKRTAINWN